MLALRLKSMLQVILWTSVKLATTPYIGDEAMIEDAILQYIFELEYRVYKKSRMHWNRWILSLKNEIIVLNATDHDVDIQ